MNNRNSARILQGDCLERLRDLPDNSVDAVVTDPPYGLTSARPGGRSEATRGAVMGGFMGLAWDSDVPSVEVWAECLRALKPGGHLLAFAGTRTQHRMAVRIEDAGFEIRDMIAWVYGSGFPKSRNLEGEWQGWGTALKPALEPITVARKPLAGTVAANVLEHGTGALNIDGCRVPTDDKLGGGAEKATTADQKGNEGWTRPWMDDEAAREAHAARVRSNVERAEAMGRFPANLIHDGSDEVLEGFPDAPGQQGDLVGHSKDRKSKHAYGDMKAARNAIARGDSWSAARFFYCAKASSADRGPGNNHPTVKPVALMRYLCRLVTPPGGLVLDPFMGSGSTGKACALEGFSFVGIERDPSYFALAGRRIADTNPLTYPVEAQS